MSLLPRVEILPEGARHSVIWLHGLGADGHDFEPIVQQLSLAEPVRFIFPHAPSMPVTINNGMVMPAWYDIRNMSIDQQQDEAGIHASAQAIIALLEHEQAQGIESQNILLAGFSQGGAIALHTGLRYHKPLAAIMGLSTYLPLADKLASERSEENRNTPVKLAHGRQDPVVPVQLAEMSQQTLNQLGYDTELRVYPMEHSVCPEEIDQIAKWCSALLL